MATSLLELEGTWEEITARVPDFSGQRLHVIVLPAEENAVQEKDPRPIADVLAEIAANVPEEELARLPSDFTMNAAGGPLRLRGGGMPPTP